jgi:hypothetical protein
VNKGNLPLSRKCITLLSSLTIAIGNMIAKRLVPEPMRRRPPSPTLGSK